jgi:hypothetical protein
MDIQKMFGGPESILKSADLIHSPSPFLDSVNFHNYNYTFAKSSTYNNHELMAIRFDSRGKVDHVREEGIIYIDMRTNAIVKIESSGDLIIPILIRPVIFMMGFGIENPTFSATQEYTQVNGSWYPKNFQVNLDLNVTRKHWFDANEHSDFQIEAIFTVNKIKPDVHDQIPVANRFDSKKEMSTQVHSEPGINWDGVNIIKP